MSVCRTRKRCAHRAAHKVISQARPYGAALVLEFPPNYDIQGQVQTSNPFALTKHFGMSSNKFEYFANNVNTEANSFGKCKKSSLNTLYYNPKTLLDVRTANMGDSLQKFPSTTQGNGNDFAKATTKFNNNRRDRLKRNHKNPLCFKQYSYGRISNLVNLTKRSKSIQTTDSLNIFRLKDNKHVAKNISQKTKIDPSTCVSYTSQRSSSIRITRSYMALTISENHSCITNCHTSKTFYPTTWNSGILNLKPETSKASKTNNEVNLQILKSNQNQNHCKSLHVASNQENSVSCSQRKEIISSFPEHKEYCETPTQSRNIQTQTQPEVRKKYEFYTNTRRRKVHQINMMHPIKSCNKIPTYTYKRKYFDSRMSNLLLQNSDISLRSNNVLNYSGGQDYNYIDNSDNNPIHEVACDYKLQCDRLFVCCNMDANNENKGLLIHCCNCVKSREQNNQNRRKSTGSNKKQYQQDQIHHKYKINEYRDNDKDQRHQKYEISEYRDNNEDPKHKKYEIISNEYCYCNKKQKHNKYDINEYRDDYDDDDYDRRRDTLTRQYLQNSDPDYEDDEGVSLEDVLYDNDARDDDNYDHNYNRGYDYNYDDDDDWDENDNGAGINSDSHDKLTKNKTTDRFKIDHIDDDMTIMCKYPSSWKLCCGSITNVNISKSICFPFKNCPRKNSKIRAANDTVQYLESEDLRLSNIEELSLPPGISVREQSRFAKPSDENTNLEYEDLLAYEKKKSVEISNHSSRCSDINSSKDFNRQESLQKGKSLVSSKRQSLDADNHYGLEKRKSTGSNYSEERSLENNGRKSYEADEFPIHNSNERKNMQSDSSSSTSSLENSAWKIVETKHLKKFNKKNNLESNDLRERQAKRKRLESETSFNFDERKSSKIKKSLGIDSLNVRKDDIKYTDGKSSSTNNPIYSNKRKILETNNSKNIDGQRSSSDTLRDDNLETEKYEKEAKIKSYRLNTLKNYVQHLTKPYCDYSSCPRLRSNATMSNIPNSEFPVDYDHNYDEHYERKVESKQYEKRSSTTPMKENISKEKERSIITLKQSSGNQNINSKNSETENPNNNRKQSRTLKCKNVISALNNCCRPPCGDTEHVNLTSKQQYQYQLKRDRNYIPIQSNNTSSHCQCCCTISNINKINNNNQFLLSQPYLENRQHNHLQAQLNKANPGFQNCYATSYCNNDNNQMPLPRLSFRIKQCGCLPVKLDKAKPSGQCCCATSYINKMNNRKQSPLKNSQRQYISTELNNMTIDGKCCCATQFTKEMNNNQISLIHSLTKIDEPKHLPVELDNDNRYCHCCNKQMYNNQISLARSYVTSPQRSSVNKGQRKFEKQSRRLFNNDRKKNSKTSSEQNTKPPSDGKKNCNEKTCPNKAFSLRGGANINTEIYRYKKYTRPYPTINSLYKIVRSKEPDIKILYDSRYKYFEENSNKTSHEMIYPAKMQVELAYNIPNSKIRYEQSASKDDKNVNLVDSKFQHLHDISKQAANTSNLEVQSECIISTDSIKRSKSAVSFRLNKSNNIAYDLNNTFRCDIYKHRSSCKHSKDLFEDLEEIKETEEAARKDSRKKHDRLQNNLSENYFFSFFTKLKQQKDYAYQMNNSEKQRKADC